MEQVALGWLVLGMTDSPFMVGVASAARMAPFFFLGIPSGVVADRVDRRAFLRYMALAGVTIVSIMAALLIADVAQAWHVVVLAAAMGCVWAFTMTLRQAYVFDIVGPELALNGLSLGAMGQRFGGVLGALIAGIVISTVGIGAQYLVVGVAYAIGAVILLGTKDVGQAASDNRESVLQNLIGYVQLVRQNRTLMTLMFLAATTEVFGFTHQSLLPVFARDVLGIGAAGLGLMTAVRQGGGMLALMFLANLSNFKRKGLLMFGASTVFGLGQMAFTLTDNVYVFIAILAFINASASIADTLYKTLMQENVPNEQRGRAMGSWVLSIGFAPVGHLGIGGLAGALGAPGALLINGSILTFASVASFIGLPKIRRLE